MSQSRKPAQNSGGTRALLPVLGLIIAIVFGVIGWLVAPNVISALADAIPAFRGNEINPTILRVIVTVVLGLLALIVFSLIAAIVAPRRPASTLEANIARDKEALKAEQQAQRDRLRKQGVRPPNRR